MPEISAPGANLESVVQFLDTLLAVEAFPDYEGAQNGLQVEGRRLVRKVIAAVDASVNVIEAAVEQEADLLLVHHGLYWDGLRPLTGRRYRRVEPLIRAGAALYSAHLPLDAHPEVGNAIGLIRALGLSPTRGFGRFQHIEVGFEASADERRDELFRRVSVAVGGPVRMVAGGPERVSRLAVVTGGGSSFVREAAELGLDTLVTGEGPHHADIDAHELGVNLLYAGHYETETFGVKSLAARLEQEFGVTSLFLDLAPPRYR